MQLWMQREVAFHYLLHMELAHLNLVCGKFLKQALHAINDDSPDGESPFLYTGNSVLVVLDTFMLDEGNVQRLAAFFVKAQKDPPVMSPVGCVHVDESAAG